MNEKQLNFGQYSWLEEMLYWQNPQKRLSIMIVFAIRMLYICENKLLLDGVMSIGIKKILLDSLKLRELSIVDLSKALCSVNGVNEVNIVVVEVDSNTETIRVTVKGDQINYNKVRNVMEKHAVSIKGVDEITVAKTILSLDE